MKINYFTKAQVLQFSAFAVAIARYMALAALAVGHNIFTTWPLFVAFEIVSWAAMAILEGFAMPYISRGMHKIKSKSFAWWQLLAYRALLLIAIPFLGAPLYAVVSFAANNPETSQEFISVASVLPPWLYWLWLFMFAALNALIVDAVGVVEAQTIDNQDNNVVNYQELEERIKELQGHNEANRELLKSILNGLKYLENMNMSDLIALVIYSSNGNMPDVTPSHLATLFNTSPVTAKKALDKAQEMKEKLGRV